LPIVPQYPVTAQRPLRPPLESGPWPRLLLIGLLVPILTEAWDLSAALLARVEQTYGVEARARVTAWRDLMAASQDLAEPAKLQVVNDFINRLQFVDDVTHWRQADYWATPVETLASGGGDCEDLAIAKYFTLKGIGLDEGKLRMSYVKSLSLNQAHMVLTYFSTPEATPLVLDNLASEVRPATERPDLVPVYSFNGTGLWLAKRRGAGKPMGEGERLNPWQNLLERIGREERR
jgi:predicted transglutaminase-like cysteine proteinase